MESVRGYIFSLMIVSVCCGVVSILTPDNSSINKYVQFILSLIVTVILLSPISSVLKVFPELIDNGINIDITDDQIEAFDYVDPLITQTLDIISEELKIQIKSKFGVEPEDVLVYCDSDDIENIIINKALVIYDSENKLLFSDTQRFVSSLIGQECEVVCKCENSG